MEEAYWLPTIPFTAVDIVNRRAAGQGSVAYARAAADADYNGHSVSVSFKPHAVCGPVWNSEYWWAGRHVLGRGGLDVCLQAAVCEYSRGAHGCSVILALSPEAPEPLEEQRRLALAAGFVPWSQEAQRAHTAANWTGKHAAVADALLWRCEGIMRLALEYEGTAAGWPAVRDAWVAARAVEWRRS